MKRILFPALFTAFFAARVFALTEADATNVALNKGSLVSVHNANGTLNTNPFGGHTSSVNQFFDGKKDDSASIENGGDGNYTPRLGAGGYFDINFSSVMPGGWYVTKITVYQVVSVTYKYSLYVSMDGQTWSPVENGVGVSGTKSYTVATTATHVKFVFDDSSGWNGNIAEIEVYGLDPENMDCTHQTKYLTEWLPVQGTASCTEPGIDQCLCTNCNTYLQRVSTSLFALGHDYESRLDFAGSGLQFGSGTISCARHDLEIVCTNGPVDLSAYGGVAVDGLVQFTDLSASSTGQMQDGVSPFLAIDNVWKMSWGHYWFAANKSVSEYLQFDFGVVVDLTSIDISIPNRTCTLQFFSVENGVEELFGEYGVVQDASLPSGDNNYQRIVVEFRGVSLKTLRIKSDDANNALTICEVHPYGTVQGAGKSAAVRTRIIID